MSIEDIKKEALEEFNNNGHDDYGLVYISSMTLEEIKNIQREIIDNKLGITYNFVPTTGEEIDTYSFIFNDIDSYQIVTKVKK